MASEPSTPAGSPTAVPAATGEVTTSFPVTLLDDGDGAELCLGGIATSLPPQCGGPRLLGWSWSENTRHVEEVGGVRWGASDGADVEPTEVVAAADGEDRGTVGGSEDRDLASPCPERRLLNDETGPALRSRRRGPTPAVVAGRGR